jgi:hypothetical protein
MMSTDTDNLVGSSAVEEGAVLQDLSIEALVQEYRDVRDDLAEARRTYSEYEAKAKSRMDEISMALRDIADRLGLNALPTSAGTAYRVEKQYFRVGNWDKILEWIKETGNYQCLEKRVAKLATKEIFDASGEVPPGIEYSMEVEFVVRKNSKS